MKYVDELVGGFLFGMGFILAAALMRAVLHLGVCS